MTMIASGSHHFQVMYSAPSATGCPKLKEPTVSPAPQVSRRESAANNPSTTAYSTKEQSVKDGHESATQSLAFVYGTLKRGFGNHWLMEEQMSTKHCRLVGTALTKYKYPLVCGPFQVPFLLDMLGSGEHVRGELYQVDTHCLGLLDELEGISKGHYMRCPVILTEIELDPSFRSCLQNGVDEVTSALQQGHNSMTKLGDVQAEAYFAATHFTPGLHQAPHIEAYTEKESATYTRRLHRPQHRTFIEHVYHWIDEQQQLSSSAVA